MTPCTSPARRRIAAFVLAFVSVGILPLAGAAQVNGAIHGVVTDTGFRAVEGAQVTVVGTSVKPTTDRNGRFTILGVPSGGRLMIIRRLGFRAVQTMVEVAESDTLRVSFMLEPVLNELGAVTVTGEARSLRMAEFDDRRRQGHGEFYTSADIDKGGTMNVADVLRQSSIIKVTADAGGQLFALSRRPANPIKNGGGCYLQVFVDGVQIGGMPDVATKTPMPVDLKTLPPANEIGGIEVYASGSTTPVKFNSGADRWCGVILVWTKDR